MAILFVFALLLIAMGVVENHLHQRKLTRIPIRIHINGTRGKSTTTRLIAGGLREAGFNVLAKTTGSAARLILEDGNEIPLKRRGIPNIIEQKRIIALASTRSVDAVVIECMAISPEKQWVSEHRLIRSTVGVITNVRQDHADQMGLTCDDVAETLSLTIPENAPLVTAEKTFLEKFKSRAAHKGSAVHTVTQSDISDEETRRFTYPVFKENVACALKVCSLLGVPREVALQGMWNAVPDPGVMKIFSLRRNGSTIYFVNSFAANDSASTLLAWEIWRNRRDYGFLRELPVVGLFNNRLDRSFRVQEFSRLFATRKLHMEQIVVLGQAGYIAQRFLQQAGIAKARIRNYQFYSPVSSISRLIDTIQTSMRGDVVLFGFGNMKGSGQKIVDYFAANGEELQ